MRKPHAGMPLVLRWDDPSPVLAHQRGEFRRAEIAAFDPETLAIVMALMSVHAAGTVTREEWVRAAELANAAQVGTGG